MGEAILLQAAQTLKALAHDNDLMCRYGDDSFAMLLTKVSGEEASCERLRESSVAFNRFADRFLAISPSIGCAVSSGGQSIASLFSHAEKPFV